ncbi:CBO0543 family protein [Ammoniphilus sp. YIM 78166]|uniref:CBO0543 family protein n=1 Tax=Ammoniphilus sp. YIM 78166 TaxID=1644106 RepID=UPI0010702C86|nr:CBO0543 family protein [Ammoniphilus sp. YIM 78166]
MVSVVFSIFWIIASWWLADWENWMLYYPTMLFSMVANLIYEVVFSEYPLWAMEPNGLPNRTLNILQSSLVGMPFPTLLYLSHFPFGHALVFKVGYMLLFIGLFVLMEYVAVRFGSISYHQGWKLLYSAFFDIGIFVILLVHFFYPLWAWAMSFGVLGVMLVKFKVGLAKMR